MEYGGDGHIHGSELPENKLTHGDMSVLCCDLKGKPI